MGNHWVQVRVDHGELVADTEQGSSGLYLTTIREWHSEDGRTWERLPDCHEVYTGGTSEPIAKYGPDIPRTLDEVLEIHSDADRPNLQLSELDDPAYEIDGWSLDSARVRREFAATTVPSDPEYVEAVDATGRGVSPIAPEADNDNRRYILLGVDDVALGLGISPQRVRALVQQRHAEGIQVGRKIGNTWIFTPDEVELLRPRSGPGRPPKDR